MIYKQIYNGPLTEEERDIADFDFLYEFLNRIRRNPDDPDNAAIYDVMIDENGGRHVFDYKGNPAVIPGIDINKVKSCLAPKGSKAEKELEEAGMIWDGFRYVPRSEA